MRIYIYIYIYIYICILKCGYTDYLYGLDRDGIGTGVGCNYGLDRDGIGTGVGCNYGVYY
jgi:hypothetical protein